MFLGGADPSVSWMKDEDICWILQCLETYEAEDSPKESKDVFQNMVIRFIDQIAIRLELED